MKSNIIRYVVMFAALCVFSYASYELTLVYLESKDSVEMNDSLSDMFLKTEVVTGENGEIQTDESGEAITMSNSGGDSTFVWDYDKLLSVNSEAKGYIRQGDGEYIDNPILQHSDNDYYLNHLPNNYASSVGSIFIDYRIKDGLEAKNCILYGHLMGSRVNYTMFGSLMWYFTHPEYGVNNPTMDVYVGDDHYVYYVFAVYKTQAVGSDTYQYSFSSDESFMEYIAKCKEKSKYDFPQAGEITAEDKIITCSTCTGAGDRPDRLIVQLVRREKVDDFGNVIEDKEEEQKPQETQPQETEEQAVQQEEKPVPESTAKKEETTTKKQESTTKKNEESKPQATTTVAPETSAQATTTKAQETTPAPTTTKAQETTPAPTTTKVQETTPAPTTTQETTTLPPETSAQAESEPASDEAGDEVTEPEA